MINRTSSGSGWFQHSKRDIGEEGREKEREEKRERRGGKEREGLVRLSEAVGGHWRAMKAIG